MKKLAWLFSILSIVAFTSIAAADCTVTVSWTPSADAYAVKQQVVLDGAVLVDDIAMATASQVFTVTDMTGQTGVIRTVGDTGPNDYIDSAEWYLNKMATGATDITVIRTCD